MPRVRPAQAVHMCAAAHGLRTTGLLLGTPRPPSRPPLACCSMQACAPCQRRATTASTSGCRPTALRAAGAEPDPPRPPTPAWLDDSSRQPAADRAGSERLPQPLSEMQRMSPGPFPVPFILCCRFAAPLHTPSTLHLLPFAPCAALCLAAYVVCPLSRAAWHTGDPSRCQPHRPPLHTPPARR